MALKKAIKQPNGVTLSYHRIASVLIITNSMVRVEVQSYIDEEARSDEQTHDASADEDMTWGCYIATQYLPMEDYSEETSVPDAYEWLKTQEEFEGAEDC